MKRSIDWGAILFGIVITLIVGLYAHKELTFYNQANQENLECQVVELVEETNLVLVGNVCVPISDYSVNIMYDDKLYKIDIEDSLYKAEKYQEGSLLNVTRYYTDDRIIFKEKN